MLCITQQELTSRASKMKIKIFKKKIDTLALDLKKFNLKEEFRKIYTNYTFIFSFLALVLIANYFNPDFLSYNNLTLLLLQSSIKGIIAAGMTLVIIAGMIDLSVGSMEIGRAHV